MKKLELFAPQGIGEIGPGDDLAAMILERCNLQQGDVLVISSKAVAKAEGSVVEKSSVVPSEFAHTLAQRTHHDAEYCELVLQQSADIVRMAPGVVICRTHHGFVMANAGVDASNCGGADRYIPLPANPDASARRLRQTIQEKTGLGVAVIVSDTFGRSWRTGQTDLAVGTAGIAPLRDHTGQPDRDGRPMAWTSLAQADELASAAELVRGKTEGLPVVVVRGYAYQGDGDAVSQIMPPERDLFR